MSSLRVGVDATPLLGNRTGIGNYTQHLIEELAGRRDLDVRAAAFSLRRRAGLGELPAGIRAVHRPVPARLLNRAWQRGRFPPAEMVMGRVDVVHGTNYVLPPPRRAAGVLTVHDLSFVHYPELVDPTALALRELVPRGIRRAAVVLTLTAAVAADLCATYGLDPDRVAVAHLAVDPAWFAATPPPTGVPADYLLAVGTLEPRKGLDVLLAAYREVLAAAPDAPPLVLAGPAGWGPELDLHGVPAARVLRPGYLDPATLRRLVGHARALVFPSRYEGFGLPPLEALAAGTPVVASDLPAVREVVGAHARLVPPGQATVLAEAILATLDAPPDAGAIEAAREHARRFTWRACADATVAAYHRARG